MTQQIKAGNGWRLGWNPSADPFNGLVAGAAWAIELTASEFEDLRRTAQQLGGTMATLAAQLMDEERLSCEQETETLWMEAEGFPTEYSLRFILLNGRRGEGEWPPAAVPTLLAALAEPLPWAASVLPFDCTQVV
ncbi:MAG: DUF1818 family protein [Phormidesmis sp.]